jgi:guanine deaminase
MLARTKTRIVHCPTSNLFLGSGLMHLELLRSEGVNLALGSDIGGGTSLSPFRTMDAAYKIQALQHAPLHPVELFYLATLGGATSLCLDKETGSLAKNKKADFVVLNPHRNRLLSERFSRDTDPLIRMFATVIHGDDRLINSVYVDGKCILSLIAP